MASGGSYVAQRHNSTAPSALAETFSRVGRNDICTCNCSALHAEKSEEMADSVVSKLCWFNSKVLNNPQRPFCQESALFGECSLFLCVSLSASQWSCFIRKSPSLCISITTLTHIHLGPSCAPLWRNHMCELKGLMQKLINPRKKFSLVSLPLYSISVVVMSSIALLNVKHTLLSEWLI